MLDISECRGIGSEVLRRALASPPALPALESLGLEGLTELDDQLLADITLALPGLLHLRISRCRCGALADIATLVLGQMQTRVQRTILHDSSPRLSMLDIMNI